MPSGLFCCVNSSIADTDFAIIQPQNVSTWGLKGFRTGPRCSINGYFIPIKYGGSLYMFTSTVKPDNETYFPVTSDSDITGFGWIETNGEIAVSILNPNAVGKTFCCNFSFKSTDK